MVDRAIALLREHEPEDGYYLAFSGGKDSCTVKKLVQLAGVKFEAWYNNVTIDPPELVRFIKKFHSDVSWNQPEHGNMLTRVATAPKVPPTRNGRWCCDEYKETGGLGRTKIFGVRAEESKKRASNWREWTTDRFGSPTCCPIVMWSKEDVWAFIHAYQVPYCELYDEGWERLGCVGCPLASKGHQDREFARWPKYEANWKRAVIANWAKWKDVPREKDGKPRYHAKFKSGEEFWQWWRNHKPPPNPLQDECQSVLLWTNEG